MRRTKITLEVVKRLAPGEIFWDSEVSGFAVRCQREAKVYCLKYRIGGRQRWFTIGRHGSPWTPDMARQEAKKILGLVVSGKDPAADKSAGRLAHTVKELGDKFLKDHVKVKRKARTAEGYQDILERIVYPKIGARRAADITRADIQKIHNDLAKTPYMANRVIAVLSKLFSLAEMWGDRADGTNPCRHVEKFREASRERFLSAKELKNLGAALRDVEARLSKSQYLLAEIEAAKKNNDVDSVARLRAEHKALEPVISAPAIAAIRLLILTGARLGEILTLRWDAVNMAIGVARLTDSKTGAKTLQLPPPAIDLLKGILQVKGNPYVITGSKKDEHLVNLQKPWREVRRIAGLDDLRIHDLRHAFASIAASSGMGLLLIGKMLGHTQPQTTARYAHLANDPVAAAAATVAESISAAMAIGANVEKGKSEKDTDK